MASIEQSSQPIEQPLPIRMTRVELRAQIETVEQERAAYSARARELSLLKYSLILQLKEIPDTDSNSHQPEIP